jgi:ubiquinone/menaquinone biosynthesis C-methylase UbiE
LKLRNSLGPFILWIYISLSLVKDNKEKLLPPRRLAVLFGGGDFEKIGNDILQSLIKIGGLKPNERVLDVGCGIGRIAVPLTNYLKDEGSYEGFDIMPLAIKWCQRKISSRFSNFHFQLADIYNEIYNPRGKYNASDYKFPYRDESFDFVILTSVFTHMFAKGIESYLSEISRVLREDGRCFITYFFLNPETITLIERRKAAYDFRVKVDDVSYTNSEESPERAMAYDEIFIKKLYERYDLDIDGSIHYGNWRKNGIDSGSFQDMIVGRKKKKKRNNNNNNNMYL